MFSWIPDIQIPSRKLHIILSHDDRLVMVLKENELIPTANWIWFAQAMLERRKVYAELLIFCRII